MLIYWVSANKVRGQERYQEISRRKWRHPLILPGRGVGRGTPAPGHPESGGQAPSLGETGSVTHPSSWTTKAPPGQAPHPRWGPPTAAPYRLRRRGLRKLWFKRCQDRQVAMSPSPGPLLSPSAWVLHKHVHICV